jgi:ABC-type sugar transport system ATPase subunit
MAGIDIQGLSKEYDGGVAVRGLDLAVHDGELLVVVGPSGCGKTTVLRSIAGLETPTAGRIWIGHRDVTDLPPAERDVAMVFQNYALYPHLTVRDNMAFGLRMRRSPKPEIARRVAAVAETLGLAALLDRKPGALSGGERQRVALGRAIVREPVAFLFDEPLSNLDARLRVQTRAELVRLHRRLATTMVYVTHDQTEAMTMGQRIAIMNAGELQQLAPPLDVYDAPANLFVAGFIGSPPMNLVTGRLDREHDVVLFRGGGLRVTLPAEAVPHREPTGDVVLGVRPEDVRLPSVAAPAADARHVGGPAPATDGERGKEAHADAVAIIQVVETLGSETLLYCRTDGGAELVVRTAARPSVRADTSVGLSLDPGRLHLFDAATGRRLGLDDA